MNFSRTSRLTIRIWREQKRTCAIGWQGIKLDLPPNNPKTCAARNTRTDKKKSMRWITQVLSLSGVCETCIIRPLCSSFFPRYLHLDLRMHEASVHQNCQIFVQHQFRPFNLVNKQLNVHNIGTKLLL